MNNDFAFGKNKHEIYFKEDYMNSEKHLKITGFSNISWKDAIVKTVEEASKTIENLKSITILEQKANICNNKICEYSVTLDIVFSIKPNRDESTEIVDNDNM